MLCSAQREQRGRTSSHFFFFSLQYVQPARDRLFGALGGAFRVYSNISAHEEDAESTTARDLSLVQEVEDGGRSGNGERNAQEHLENGGAPVLSWAGGWMMFAEKAEAAVERCRFASHERL